jgi:hypothetical protein
MVGDQSFGIQTAQEFFDNLVRPDWEAFQNNLLDPGAAIRVAVSLTHLMEWVFEDRNSLDLSKIGAMNPASSKALRDQIESMNPEIRWLRDVSNGSKHCTITLYTPEVTSSAVAEWGQLNWGDFPSDRSVFALHLAQGEHKNYEDVVKAATSFWKQLFS